MKMKYQHYVFILLMIVTIFSCRIVKLGQFSLSKNHQKPKQQKVTISNNPESVFNFKSDDRGYNEFISQMNYTQYSIKENKTYRLSEYLDDETRTTAFIVIRKDTILFEEYYEGYNENSLLPSWSVAKSFIGALVGIAIKEGYLQEDNNVTQFLPYLNEYNTQWSELTVQHLLNMRSGIDFDEENYTNPYSDIADLYISKNIPKLLEKLQFAHKPGSTHYYSSLDTEILSLVLESAIDKPISQYLQEKIWIPLGMESSSTWAVDSKKSNNTKGFCCLNATLRDYAKFARLYLKNGYWEEKQVIDSVWINNSIKPNFNNDCYQNQWYSHKSYEFSKDTVGNYQLLTFQDSISAQQIIKDIDRQRPVKHWSNEDNWVIQNCGPEYFALGIFGQELFIDPETEMIFIRLGKKWDTVNTNIFSQIRYQVRDYK